MYPDGWIPPNETWTYASATTITVPSGATNKYQKGDKIKLTQGSIKYFYIINVTSTVLTITGGSDYTLTNSAISNNYYSKVENPQGFPDWFNYNPAPTFSGTAPQNPTAYVTARFKVSGKSCTVNIYYIYTTAGSNNTQVLMSLPIAVSLWGAAAAGSITNGATTNNCRADLYSGTARVIAITVSADRVTFFSTYDI